ncbi:unnamed protein product [marine sediment metagenome]|uniref:Glutamate-1-semialdehyde 2,1-aminomutase n=1 Tax=marine sediment metagenome TaxID=412755 RepID=X0SQ19_9ZZZZ
MLFCEFTDKEIAYSPRDLKEADKEKQRKLCSLLLEEGVMLGPPARWYISGGLTEADVDKTLEIADRVVGKL